MTLMHVGANGGYLAALTESPVRPKAARHRVRAKPYAFERLRRIIDINTHAASAHGAALEQLIRGASPQIATGGSVVERPVTAGKQSCRPSRDLKREGG